MILFIIVHIFQLFFLTAKVLYAIINMEIFNWHFKQKSRFVFYEIINYE